MVQGLYPYHDFDSSWTLFWGFLEPGFPKVLWYKPVSCLWTWTCSPDSEVPELRDHAFLLYLLFTQQLTMIFTVAAQPWPAEWGSAWCPRLITCLPSGFPGIICCHIDWERVPSGANRRGTKGVLGRLPTELSSTATSILHLVVGMGQLK